MYIYIYIIYMYIIYIIYIMYIIYMYIYNTFVCIKVNFTNIELINLKSLIILRCWKNKLVCSKRVIECIILTALKTTFLYINRCCIFKHKILFVLFCSKYTNY